MERPCEFGVSGFPGPAAGIMSGSVELICCVLGIYLILDLHMGEDAHHVVAHSLLFAQVARR